MIVTFTSAICPIEKDSARVMLEISIAATGSGSSLSQDVVKKEKKKTDRRKEIFMSYKVLKVPYINDLDNIKRLRTKPKKVCWDFYNVRVTEFYEISVVILRSLKSPFIFRFNFYLW